MDNKIIDYSLLKGYALAIFYKKNGSYRRVVCTTNLKLIPKDKWPKTNIPWDDNVRIFDLDENKWKSFKKINFIGLVELQKR
jgi:hypothetical protein